MAPEAACVECGSGSGAGWQSGETLARTLNLWRVSAGIADCTSALQKKALSSRYEQNVIVMGITVQAWLSQKVVIPECDDGVLVLGSDAARMRDSDLN